VLLRAEVTEVAGVPVVALSGRVDLATLPALSSALSRAVVAHPARVVAVDLDAVEALDDSGLGVLLGAAGRARANAGDVVVICTNAALLARFAQTGLDRAIAIGSNVAAVT